MLKWGTVTKACAAGEVPSGPGKQISSLISKHHCGEQLVPMWSNLEQIFKQVNKRNTTPKSND